MKAEKLRGEGDDEAKEDRMRSAEEELISRQAAIGVLESWLNFRGYSEGELNMLKAAINVLRALPTVWVLTERDFAELRYCFGDEVEMVVRDMVSGEGKRWNTTTGEGMRS